MSKGEHREEDTTIAQAGGARRIQHQNQSSDRKIGVELGFG